MSIFNKVAFASLKKNKTRTVATIVGIILSAAMICAVTTSISSALNFMKDYAKYNTGDWYGGVYSVEKEALDDLRSSEDIEKLTYAKQLGYAIAEGCANPDKPYLYILGAGEGFEGMMPVHLTSGRYPASAEEILLPNHLLDNGGVAHRLGDQLVLRIGDRVSEGFVLNQDNPYRGSEAEDIAESLEIRETRTYTVVGFYERPDFEQYSAPGYTAITLDTAGVGSEKYDIYFKTERAGGFYDFLSQFTKKHGISNFQTNTDLLMYSGTMQYPEFYLVVYGVAAIVIVLILFGAVSLIYNAFSISVSERTKQFGLLSSVGATKKQIRKMVLFEALAVSAVGIPLGVLAGIGGIGLTFHFVGDMFTGMGFPEAVPLRLCVSWQSVVAACVIALGTVFISAWIPSIRATHVTAIDAIRQSKDIKVDGKTVKTSKLTYRLFGLPGVIASKHFKRNRKKYRTTVISLFMSIVLFVSAASFVSYTKKIVDVSYGTLGYDLIYYASGLDKDRDIDKLLTDMKSAQGITDGNYYGRYLIRVDADRAALTKDFLEDYADVLEIEEEDKTANFLASVIFVQDEEYKEILAENGLSEKQYMDTNAPLAVAFDQYKTFSATKEKYTTGHFLSVDKCELEYEYEKDLGDYYVYEVFEGENGEKMCRLEHFFDEENTKVVPYDEIYTVGKMSVGAVIDKAPYFVETAADMVMLYPYSAARTVLVGMSDAMSVHFVFKSDDHKASYKGLGDVLSANGLTKQNLYDYAEIAEDNRNMITVINVFAYGFIILISLIAATNVFNTVSTGISLRRREFAMLKSVGMTSKGFNKMMNYECLLYGAKALLFGLPTSFIITYLIYFFVSHGAEISFVLPWSAIGIAVFSVFAVVFATMMYSMGKIKKDNPIDALKNENL